MMKQTRFEKSYYSLGVPELQQLFSILQQECDELYGPKEKDGAICMEKLGDFADLPRGLGDTQEAGSYRLTQTRRQSFFDYTVGPHSVKNILHPSQRKLWQANRDEEGVLSFKEEIPRKQKIGFFGIRSCDTEALKILDKVFLHSGYKDLHYENLRKDLVLITATCSQPGAVCFCTSMGHGPKPLDFDINITEVCSDKSHYFVAETGTEFGQTALARIDASPADKSAIVESEQVYKRSCKAITKSLNTENLPAFLAANPEHPHWDRVADKCLSCANCTMVCPTCFCTSTADVNDLEGDHSERWLHWDSCFTGDFSYIHGGSVRKTTKSRYRQWLTHKLSSWQTQFDSSGCVGCGRCVAWCPVGIDLTEEVKSLRDES